MSQTAIIGFWAFYAVLTFGSVGYALLKGGDAERQTGLMLLVVMLAATAVQFVIRDPQTLRFVQLFMDGVGGLLYLRLAMKFQQPWLVACLLVMTAQFSMQTIWEVNQWEHHNWFAGLNNLLSLTLFAILTWATATARRRGSVRSQDQGEPLAA
jgi:lysylphosphatidylglycerol synthetase-like protein (DUF2156 family)